MTAGVKCTGPKLDGSQEEFRSYNGLTNLYAHAKPVEG